MTPEADQAELDRDTHHDDDAPRGDVGTPKEKRERGKDDGKTPEKDADDKKKDDGEGGGDKDGKDGKDKPKSRWPLVIVGIVVVLALVGGGLYWFLTRNETSTDDAYTEGNAIAITPKVSGYVVSLDVNDNTIVKAGQLLLKIDPRDYVASRDQARANLALAQSQLASAQVDLDITRVRAPADLVQAQAKLAQAKATQVQAERDFRRLHSIDPRATTQTNVDQATATLSSQTANVQSAEAQVSTASLVPQNVKAAEDTVRQRQAQVAQAQANLETAELNLSYTEIRAPQTGQVTRRNVDLGTYAQAGQQVFYLVADQVWVVANFKETQLARMRIGQHVDISVDAYPDLKLSGHVDSIQAGSGARFSTFPAENATGNFVKIVRRIPVKIVIDHGLEQGEVLPLGLSVTPTVQLQ